MYLKLEKNVLELFSLFGISHSLVDPLCGTSWDKWNWGKIHRGYRTCPGTRKGLQRGYMTRLVPWDKERSLLTFPSPCGTGLVQAACLSHWDKHNLSQSACFHWDRLYLSQLFVPVGQVGHSHHPSKVSPWASLAWGSFLIKYQRGPNPILEVPYQKLLSNWSKIETKNQFLPLFQ